MTANQVYAAPPEEEAHSDSRFVLADGTNRVAAVFVVVATLGFLCLHRFFAHLGAPALGLSTGELVLAAAFVYRPTRAAILGALRWLLEPNPLHVVAWTGVAFVLYGVFTTVRGYQAGYGLEAIRHLSYVYYLLALPLGIWLASVVPDFLRRFSLWLAWVNGVYAVAYILVLDRLDIAAPITGTPLILGSASGLAILGLLCTHRNPRAVWYLFVLNGIGVAVAQARAEWVAFAIGLGVWALLERRARDLTIMASAAVILLLVLQLMAVELPTASTRSGSVTVAGIAGRAVAPFDQDLAASFTDDYVEFSVSARWRTRWWGDIWQGVHADDNRTVIGFGAGYPLASLTNFVDPEVGTPHNLTLYALGYGGWVGLTLLALFQLSVFQSLREARRRDRSSLGLVWFSFFLTISHFTPWYDSPIGAFPSYLLLGAALAPLAPSEFAGSPSSRVAT